MFRHKYLAIFFILLLLDFNTASANYHLVGWFNTAIPGSGRVILGEPLLGAGEAALSIGAFGYGYRLTGNGPLTLDGTPTQLPKFGTNTRRSTTEESITTPLYADMLQEIGIKSHLSFVFLSYREAAKREGVTAGIDQSPVNDLFLAPFKIENIASAWVLIPIVFTGLVSFIDFKRSQNDGLPVVPRLTPYSNFLYAVDYQVVSPNGSGAPEEMFYRGFLQHELRSAVDSPFFSIPLTSAAFAFSHEPGFGRITAAISGMYLGYLADRYSGNLQPGITVHFWSSVMLGIETVFLSHEAQRTTPPTALSIQIN